MIGNGWRAVLLATAALALAAPAPAAADRGGDRGWQGSHVHSRGVWGPRVGVYWGGPAYWGPWWGWPGSRYGGPYGPYGYYGYYGYYGDYGYASPYGYGYPVPPAVLREPVPYVEKPAADLWYWCADPAGYYPHVASCRRPWQAVAPADVRGGAPETPRSAP